MKDYKYIIGIDEVGRGPVAGPVAVGAVLFSVENKTVLEEFFSTIKDSKKLTPKKRNEWFEKINGKKEEGLLDYRVVFVESNNIDGFGIVPSIQSCLDKSLESLCGTSDALQSECLVLLDGGLKAPKEFINQETIIKGDEKETIISIASVMAKVSRDSVMCKLAKEYPEYNFEKHKGYGTKAHMEAIQKNGMCKQHRRSFLKKFTQ